MAAIQQGGRRPDAGRPRFVTAASRPARAVLRFDKELHSSRNILKQRGGLTVCGASYFSGGVQAESAGSIVFLHCDPKCDP